MDGYLLACLWARQHHIRTPRLRSASPRTVPVATSKTSRNTGSRPSGSSGSPRGGSSRRPAGAKPPARPTKASPPPPNRVLEAFNGHGPDVAGVVLIVVGVLAGLALYGDLAGPVGRGLGSALRFVFGVVAYVAPPVLVAAGVVVLRRRNTDDPAGMRVLVGGGLGALAVIGLLHLALGGGGPGSPREDLEGSAGMVGAILTAPLSGLLGVWAAAVVLVAVGAIGVVVAINRPLHDMGAAIMRVLAPVGALVARGWHALFTLGDEPAGEADAASGSGATTDAGGSGREDVPEVVPVVAGGTVVNLPDSPADGAADADPGTDAETGDEGGVDDADDLAAITPEWLRPAPMVPATDADNPPEQLTIDLGPVAQPTTWKLPKASLLSHSDRHEVDTDAVAERGRLLEQALAEHGVETRLVGMVVGPTVTRFELELGPGVKVARVTSLNRDIAYAMASPDVRILAPIPGRQAIGVEVPNADRQVVSLGDVLSSSEARNANEPLDVAFGRDINGNNILVDLATMPHMLIAGQTGAGKSSCINSIITSVLMRSTPDQVRMILIDPKRVELGQYNRLPHLLTQVVTNPKKAANALSWAVREMERRYDLLSELGFRDIGGYNAAFDRGELNPEDDVAPDGGAPDGGAPDGDAPGGARAGADGSGREPAYQRLPLILIVVDELNDLMMVAARDVEDSICRIAQMARAVGIHLVVATQRPSVNVITGVIKANIPSRLAFAVSSLADSRVILDQPGAERLVGRGDMLLVGASSSIAQRIQGCWVSEAEVRSVVGHWRRQAPDVAFDDAAVQGNDDQPGTGGGGSAGGDDDDDELLAQATELVVRSQLGSTSMLQRKLRVGFARAGRLMDLLEQRGVVGPSEGSKARAVLMTPEELDAATGQAWSDEAIGLNPDGGDGADGGGSDQF